MNILFHVPSRLQNPCNRTYDNTMYKKPKALRCLIKHCSMKKYSVGVGLISRNETEVSGHGQALAALPLGKEPLLPIY